MRTGSRPFARGGRVDWVGREAPLGFPGAKVRADGGKIKL